MISYTYSYLLLGLLFLVFWTSLFIWRKDTRKAMLVMSTIFGIAGLLVEPIYVQDWWKPITITNTLIGFEDFLFGFVIGGIAAVIYEDIFKKKMKIRKKTKKITERENMHFFTLIIVFGILFFSSFLIFNLNTLYSSLIAFLPLIGFIYYKRKDLILDSIFSGALLTILSFIIYSILNLITPGWVQKFWYFKNVPPIIIFGVPIDDIIWYFLAGAFIAPLYEYWLEGKLINKK